MIAWSIFKGQCWHFSKSEVVASFPGGFPAWKKFLEKNFDASAPFKDVPRKTKYFKQTATRQFIICKDGTICDIKVVNKVLPTIKKEVKRVIKYQAIGPLLSKTVKK